MRGPPGRSAGQAAGLRAPAALLAATRRPVMKSMQPGLLTGCWGAAAPLGAQFWGAELRLRGLGLFCSQVEAKRALPKDESPVSKDQQAAANGHRTKKIFVGGLPPSVDDETFRQYFGEFGEVRRQGRGPAVWAARMLGPKQLVLLGWWEGCSSLGRHCWHAKPRGFLVLPAGESCWLPRVWAALLCSGMWGKLVQVPAAASPAWGPAAAWQAHGAARQQQGSSSSRALRLVVALPG